MNPVEKSNEAGVDKRVNGVHSSDECGVGDESEAPMRQVGLLTLRQHAW